MLRSSTRDYKIVSRSQVTPPHRVPCPPYIFRLDDEAALLVGRVLCGRVCDGHGGSIRAERREDAVGGLNGQAKSAVCREERLNIEHIRENE